MRQIKLVAIFWLVGLSTFLSSCFFDADYLTLKGQTMGTTWSVTYQKSSSISATQLQSQIQQRLDEINQVMSTYIPDSELSKLNQASINQWHFVSFELLKLIQRSIEISKSTDGAFDITVGKAVNHYGFGSDDSSAEPQLNSIGYWNLQIQANKILKKTQVYIDLSAIAKGYAVDEIAKHLQQHQIQNYLVEIGGEIAVKGLNKQGKPWQVAVEKPTLQGREILAILALKDKSIASSGSYRNYKKLADNKIITHTIDPKTGQPITHKVIASSVIHSNTATADALATAYMVLSPEKSIQLANQQNVAMLIILGDLNDLTKQRFQYSQLFSKYLKNHTILSKIE